MACAGCRQRAMIATRARAVRARTAPASCRTCVLTRFALLWIVGVGGIALGAIYWLVGFGPCGCLP
jgi:hypothetical protein